MSSGTLNKVMYPLGKLTIPLSLLTVGSGFWTLGFVGSHLMGLYMLDRGVGVDLQNLINKGVFYDEFELAKAICFAVAGIYFILTSFIIVRNDGDTWRMEVPQKALWKPLLHSLGYALPLVLMLVFSVMDNRGDLSTEPRSGKSVVMLFIGCIVFILSTTFKYCARRFILKEFQH